MISVMGLTQIEKEEKYFLSEGNPYGLCIFRIYPCYNRVNPDPHPRKRSDSV